MSHKQMNNNIEYGFCVADTRMIEKNIRIWYYSFVSYMIWISSRLNLLDEVPIKKHFE